MEGVVTVVTQQHVVFVVALTAHAAHVRVDLQARHARVSIDMRVTVMLFVTELHTIDLER